MPTYYAERALLMQGWADAVRIDVSSDGFIRDIQTRASADGAQYLKGPLLPGMPNLHSHAFQRAMAGLAEVAGNPQDSFWSWRELMYRLAGRITPEQLETIARQLYIEMLKAGYTSVCEFHYVHHDPHGRHYSEPAELALRISRAAESSGIGLTLLPVLYSYAGFGAQAPHAGQRRFINAVDSYLGLLESIRSHLATRPHQSAGLCLHSLRAVTPEQIRQVLAADSSDCPIHIHIAEQQQEVDDCLAWSGRRPLQWLYENAPVDARWCLVHATHATTDEVSAMAQSNAVVGICPTTEANLGDGIFPATDYLAQGGRFGIGSDSHVSLSVVEELRWLEYGQRLRDQKRNRLYRQDNPMVGRTLLDASLAGGAQASGQAIGALAVGRRADLIVLDDQDPYIATARGDALLNRWLFASSTNPIRDVMVAGQWVVKDGHHPLEADSAASFSQALKTLLDS